MVDNFSWVIDGLLCGAALPGGGWSGPGGILRGDLADLHDRGVRVLVSLLEVPAELGRLCGTLGIEWLSYPIDNFSVPTDPPSFDLLIEGILKRMERGLPVCAHCFAGVGRTGLVLTCALGRRLGLDAARAIRAVRRFRSALETPEQERFVARYLSGDLAGPARG